MAARTVLIVEDEDDLRYLLVGYFTREGFAVVEADNGQTAIDQFAANKVDLIILDVMLPEIDGWSVCRLLRQSSDVPIIMLTARSEEYDRLLGFDLGVDEYVTKPFSPRVLVAQARALMKRIEGTIGRPDGVVQVHGIKIDNVSHRVEIDGMRINLSPKEYDLLIYLMTNRGRVLSREQLLDKIWGYNYEGGLRTVDTHIKRLRVKLASCGKLICTVRGFGYRLED
ncbi:MAG: response regulator transcription factor [Methylocystaceae bacterium]